jgi:hypothetical protein
MILMQHELAQKPIQLIPLQLKNLRPRPDEYFRMAVGELPYPIRPDSALRLEQKQVGGIQLVIQFFKFVSFPYSHKTFSLSFYIIISYLT